MKQWFKNLPWKHILSIGLIWLGSFLKLQGEKLKEKKVEKKIIKKENKTIKLKQKEIKRQEKSNDCL